MLIRFANFIGSTVLDSCHHLGNVGVFALDAISTLFSTRLKLKKVLFQMSYIGVESLSIVILVGSAVGALAEEA